MKYIDVALFLLDGHTDRLMGVADLVGDVTGSEAARAGSILPLIVVSFVSVILGLVLLIVAAPFLAVWTAVSLIWSALKWAFKVVRPEVP
ncbi:hypothetical protein [Stenotrophomonas sp. BIGb0135]|uniref:hypothetical protein n=1 Tax=Stenotrophomonas sp. BIGb0135 TaxID=2940620 RepID=UPI002168D520|nr:hypothetical protein [Stenotrophomonas sp. BIGb0135]MCS4234433.1 putative membrane protein [Stenotrophomonas sp. BIGb0135]